MNLWTGMRWGAATALLALFVMASPVAAAPPCNTNPVVQQHNPHCSPSPSGPSPSATPELDSLVLFGSGLVSAAGYGLLRLRARRRA